MEEKLNYGKGKGKNWDMKCVNGMKLGKYNLKKNLPESSRDITNVELGTTAQMVYFSSGRNL